MLKDERAESVARANEQPTLPPPGGRELYHFSDDGQMRRFAPHVPSSNPSHPAAVWAIDAAHAPLYWFPRHCPRVSVWARDAEQQALLTDVFETEASRLCAAETRWMERVRDARVYRYAFDAKLFEPWNEADGQYVAYETVYASRVDELSDLFALYAGAEVELRFTPRLGSLIDRILYSGLPFSFVRIRDAAH